MKPFDIKAAKRGDRVVMFHHGICYDVRIVCFDRKFYDIPNGETKTQIGFLIKNSRLEHEELYWVDEDGLGTIKNELYNSFIKLLMFEEVKDHAILYSDGQMSRAMTKDEADKMHYLCSKKNKVVRLSAHY